MKYIEYEYTIHSRVELSSKSSLPSCDRLHTLYVYVTFVWLKIGELFLAFLFYAWMSLLLILLVLFGVFLGGVSCCFGPLFIHVFKEIT